MRQYSGKATVSRERMYELVRSPLITEKSRAARSTIR